jgi:hypothetical protein
MDSLEVRPLLGSEAHPATPPPFWSPNGKFVAISLFNRATPVGSLSYAATPDPSLPGGFAGIQSTLTFNRVEVTFNSVSATAFALDNVRRGPQFQSQRLQRYLALVCWE